MPWLVPEEVEVEVIRWLVEPGERVEIDQDLLELTVDGATFILPSPLEGTLLEWQVQPGEYVATDEILAVIDAD